MLLKPLAQAVMLVFGLVLAVGVCVWISIMNPSLGEGLLLLHGG